MAKWIIAVCLLALTASIVLARPAPVPSIWERIGVEPTEEIASKVCDGLHTSLLSPVKCKDDAEIKDPHRIAKSFKAKYGEPGQDYDLEPVILLPGLGGSGLEAQIHKDESPKWYCSKNWDWYQIWLAIYEILVQPCWFDNLQLDYYPSNNTYANRTGVQIAPLDFGGLEGVDYLDHVDDILKLTGYYATLIKTFEGVGYQAGVNIFGAPYDWRLPTAYLAELGFQSQLAALVEQAYAASGNKKVHLITHSMGGPTALYFMLNQPAEWKDQYIASFIPIAGPWSGSAKALRGLVSGDNFGLEVLGFSLVNLQSICDVARDCGGIVELIPDAYFYPSSQVFIQTPSKNYTASDFTDTFNDLGIPNTAAIYGTVQGFIDNMGHPNVTTYCLYGYNSETEIAYVYDNDFDGSGGVPQPSTVDYSNMGDGTVPLESLQECIAWQSQGTPVQCKEYDLESHLDILKDDELIQDVLLITTGQPSITGCNPEVLPRRQELEVRTSKPFK